MIFYYDTTAVFYGIFLVLLLPFGKNILEGDIPRVEAFTGVMCIGNETLFCYTVCNAFTEDDICSFQIK
jgi:hypothetical protein